MQYTVIFSQIITHFNLSLLFKKAVEMPIIPTKDLSLGFSDDLPSLKITKVHYDLPSDTFTVELDSIYHSKSMGKEAVECINHFKAIGFTQQFEE